MHRSRRGFQHIHQLLRRSCCEARRELIKYAVISLRFHGAASHSGWDLLGGDSHGRLCTATSRIQGLGPPKLGGYYCLTLPWLVAARSFGHSMYRLVPPQTGHSITWSIARLGPSFSIGWTGLEPSAGVGHAAVIARGGPRGPLGPPLQSTVSGPRLNPPSGVGPFPQRYLRYPPTLP